MKKNKRKAGPKKLTKTRTRQRVFLASDELKQKMLKVIMRRKRVPLAVAVRDAGIALPTFYYHLKRASFGAERRGARGKRIAISAMNARRLEQLVKRQQKLQASLEKFTRTVLG